MKIHPLFDRFIEHAFVPEKSSDAFRATANWYEAGKPIVEESTAQTDAEDKHPIPKRRFVCEKHMCQTCADVDAKDARIRELEMNLSVSQELLKCCQKGNVERQEKIKELEAKVALYEGTCSESQVLGFFKDNVRNVRNAALESVLQWSHETESLSGLRDRIRSEKRKA